ncbi:phosphoribosylglycinamide formyltransferase, chloroplastic isoform X2 [Aristolochia californica]|uniref:phosphoribosylglycinamide formyltransferase, chloroplastic isoform X2 n=1 Tax=Aristolochia californica TaxID=171875 RepID=UPI0035DE7825
MEAKNLNFALYPQKYHNLCSKFSSCGSFESRKCSPCKTGMVSKIYCQRRAVVKALVCRSKAENSDFVGLDSGELNNGSWRKKLAVFVSGGGSNFRAIHEATERGLINGDVTVLVTDKPGCGGALYAREKGIPVIVFPWRSSVPEGLSASDLVTSLRKYEIDFILLAGYLKLIPVELVQAYPKSIINIHPSLLPAFGGKGYYGKKVHKAVIASGARYSGPTIHFVDEHYDTGRILAQRVIPVMANDSAEQLAARVLHEVRT